MEMAGVEMPTKWMNWAEEVERMSVKERPAETIVPEVKETPDVKIDFSKVPTQPPFTVMVFNIPTSAKEEDLSEFFDSASVRRVNFVYHGRGNFQGTAYVELIDRNALISALNMTGKTLQTRTIRVELPKMTVQSRQSSAQGGMRNNRMPRESNVRRHQSGDNGARRFSETGQAPREATMSRQRNESNDVRNVSDYQFRRSSVEVPQQGFVGRQNSEQRDLAYGANQAPAARRGSRQFNSNAYGNAQPYAGDNGQRQGWRAYGPSSDTYYRNDQPPMRGRRFAKAGTAYQGGNSVYNDRGANERGAATLPRDFSASGRRGGYQGAYSSNEHCWRQQQQQQPVDEQPTGRALSNSSRASYERTRLDSQSRAAKIFGEAKPVDTDRRLREIEQQRLAVAANTAQVAEPKNEEDKGHKAGESGESGSFDAGHVTLLRRPPQPAVAEEPLVEPEALAKVIEKQQKCKEHRAAVAERERTEYQSHRGGGRRGGRGRGRAYTRSFRGRYGERSQPQLESANATDSHDAPSKVEGEHAGSNLDRERAKTVKGPVERHNANLGPAPVDIGVGNAKEPRKEVEQQPAGGHRRTYYPQFRQFYRGSSRSASKPRYDGSTAATNTTKASLPADWSDKTKGSSSSPVTSSPTEVAQPTSSVTKPSPPPPTVDGAQAKSKSRRARKRQGRGNARQAFTDKNKYDLLKTMSAD